MASTNVVRKSLPSAVADGSEASNWGARYGEQIVQPLHGSKHALAEVGCYFVATSPTPMTGIALTTSITTFAETAGAVGDSLLIKNTETGSANSAKRIYPDYLRIRNVTQAPTSATDWYISGVLDYSAVRYTSGGSQITPINANGDSSLASVATIYFGALTTAIPASRRLLFSLMVLPRLMIIKDMIILQFGGISGDVIPPNSAAIMDVAYNVPPCVIGPAQNLTLKMWGTANAAAAQFEFDFGYWEK
mgnify:CR=1 FL=1